MNVLFVCGQGKNRSPTAAALFREEHATRSCGLYCERPLDEKLLSWANLVVVMEDAHRQEIAQRFPALYLSKRILSLDVPDIYRRDQPELVALLREKMRRLEP